MARLLLILVATRAAHHISQPSRHAGDFPTTTPPLFPTPFFSSPLPTPLPRKSAPSHPHSPLTRLPPLQPPLSRLFTRSSLAVQPAPLGHSLRISCPLEIKRLKCDTGIPCFSTYRRAGTNPAPPRQALPSPAQASPARPASSGSLSICGGVSVQPLADSWRRGRGGAGSNLSDNNSVRPRHARGAAAGPLDLGMLVLGAARN